MLLVVICMGTIMIMSALNILIKNVISKLYFIRLKSFSEKDLLPIELTDDKKRQKH